MNSQGKNVSPIAYGIYDAGDIGPIFIAATPAGLCAVALRSPKIPERVKKQAKKLGKELVEDPAQTAPYFAQIEAYLRGERREFDLPIDWSCVESDFQREVLRALAGVPFGQLVSYADLAEQIGRPGAARAVGTAMAKNPIPLVLPCHRVIRRDGKLGGYTGGLDIKQRLLSLEGSPAGK